MLFETKERGLGNAGKTEWLPLAFRENGREALGRE
jgi:hypothetical protein